MLKENKENLKESLKITNQNNKEGFPAFTIHADKPHKVLESLEKYINH